MRRKNKHHLRNPKLSLKHVPKILLKKISVIVLVVLSLGFLGLDKIDFNNSYPSLQETLPQEIKQLLFSAPRLKTATKYASNDHIDEDLNHRKVRNFSKAKQLIPNPISDFHAAKKIARKLFLDHRQTFYCNCKFDKHNRIDLKSCGYIIQQDKRRAERIEWEHIVPISHLAAHLECWRKPICCEQNSNCRPHKNFEQTCFRGRKCCQLKDSDFSKMEADLHNLVPEIGELNAMRSNYRFGELPGIRHKQFGQCEMKIDAQTRRVEPSNQVKGIIARAYLYMSDTYDFHLSDSQRQLFSAWNAEFPPDPWEKEWDNRIFRIQGNHNLYISKYTKKTH